MITIRKTEESDIKLVVSCLENKPGEFIGQCGYGPGRLFASPITEKQILTFQKLRSKGSVFFTILNDGVIIGSLELILHKDEKKCSIARFLIYDGYRFKGYGTETLNIIKDYVFNELCFNKINLGVFDFNESALKCYEKSGFAEAGRTIMENNWIRIDMEITKPS